jgi:hypothetical protein
MSQARITTPKASKKPRVITNPLDIVAPPSSVLPRAERMAKDFERQLAALEPQQTAPITGTAVPTVSVSGKKLAAKRSVLVRHQLARLARGHAKVAKKKKKKEDPRPPQSEESAQLLSVPLNVLVSTDLMAQESQGGVAEGNGKKRQSPATTHAVLLKTASRRSTPPPIDKDNYSGSGRRPPSVSVPSSSCYYY